MTAIVFLWVLSFCPKVVSGEDRKLTLDISVTNPSNDESQETEVKVDLPPELKKEDIISSDGLKIGFNSEKKCLFVEGRILLQAAETTIYKLAVKDVWEIPVEEIESLKTEQANLMSESERLVLSGRFEKIFKRQKDSQDNISAHILAFRESKKEIESLREDLQAARNRLQDSERKKQRMIWMLLGLMGSGLLGLLMVIKRRYLKEQIKNIIKTGLLGRRPPGSFTGKAEMQIRLLPEGEFGPGFQVNNISPGGISVNLDRSLPLQATLEMKLKLPADPEFMKFRGFIVWSKIITSADGSEKYLAGISLAEVAQKYYQKLFPENLRYFLKPGRTEGAQPRIPQDGEISGGERKWLEKKILVVDDEEGFVRVLKYRLEAAGFQVSFALSGQEAIEEAARNKPDLIILDVVMSPVSGSDVYLRLQEKPETRAIPIIFISGEIDVFGSLERRKFSSVAFLYKPYDPEELLKRISDIFDHRNMETVPNSRLISGLQVRDGRELSLVENIVLQGLVTREKMDEFLKQKKDSGNSIVRNLINSGFAEEKPVLLALSGYFNMPYLELKDASIEEEAVKKIPAKFALYYKIMPVRIEAGTIVCAISDPLSTAQVQEDINVYLNLKLKLLLSLKTQIVETIKKFYGVGAETVDKILSEEGENLTRELLMNLDKDEDVAKLAEDASIIKLVNQILIEAQEKNATDVHIEPYQGKLKLRYRIDGILYDTKVPANIVYFLPAIISRVKIMSGLNIVERRIPQDGRAKVKIKDEIFDLRISTLPTPYGESMVIRILPLKMLFGLEELGLSEGDLLILEKLITKPHGIIFVTGPTGSGKTTTLYTCLSKIKKENPGAKILTIEDPIEYELEGITQMQVNPAINLTFAAGLRSMLRHDPDIMMVGEVRDFETAEIAIRMALTGHLLFSTLHTNDAATGAMRLMDMGVESYLVASSVEAFIAQRLVRVICRECREEVPVPQPQPIEIKTAYKGRGCEACNFTGYKGRTAIYEMLLVSEKIKELIQSKASSEEINRQAILEGMKTLYQYGIEKVVQGITTFEEVLRVTQVSD